MTDAIIQDFSRQLHSIRTDIETAEFTALGRQTASQFAVSVRLGAGYLAEVTQLLDAAESSLESGDIYNSKSTLTVARTLWRKRKSQLLVVHDQCVDDLMLARAIVTFFAEERGFTATLSFPDGRFHIVAEKAGSKYSATFRSYLGDPVQDDHIVWDTPDGG